jgi:ankyrin repeat protein
MYCVTSCCVKFGLTPLSLACVNGSPDAVDYLLNEGCSTNVQNNYSETPLHHAAKSDNKKAKERVIELLMKANATANVKDWVVFCQDFSC